MYEGHVLRSLNCTGSVSRGWLFFEYYFGVF